MIQTIRKPQKIAFVAFLSAFFWCLWTLPAMAATRTWDGGGADAKWSTCANWTANTCPTAADSVVFNGTLGAASLKSATIDVPVTVIAFTISSGYTGTITQGSAITLTTSGSFSQADGIFTGSNAGITVAGGFNLSGGSFTSTSSTLSVAGNFNHTAGTFTHNSGSVVLNPAANRSFVIPTTATFYNLQIAPSVSATKLIMASGTVATVLNTLTLTEGVFTLGTIEAQGSVVVASGWDGTDASTTGTLLIDGTSAVTSFIPTGVPALAGTITLNNSLYTLQASGTGAINGRVVNVESGTLDLRGVDVSISSNLTVSGGTVLFDDGTTTIGGIFTQSDGVVESRDAVMNFSRGWNVTGGTFTAPSGAMTITGNVTYTGGTVQANGGSTTLDPSVDRSIMWGGVSALNNLTIAPTVGTVTVTVGSGSLLDVDGDLTLSAGTFNANGQPMNVGGDFVLDGGMFISNSNTVTLDGADQAIQGEVTFGDLSKEGDGSDTLSFPAAQTVTIAGSADLHGLSLRSTSDGTAALVDFQGTVDISAVDVQDQTALNAQGVRCVVDCVDGGNNTNWFFVDDFGLVIEQTDGSTQVIEGGSSDTYTVVLSAPPADDVTIALDTDLEVTTDVTELLFTSATWATPQTVTVTAIDDLLDERSSQSVTITHTLTSADELYDGLSAEVGGEVIDNDAPPTLSWSLAEQSINEAAGAILLTVELSTASAQDVSANLEVSGTATGGEDYTYDPEALIIFAGETSVVVELNVEDDVVDEEDEVISFTLTDLINADARDPLTQTITIVDNDATPTLQWTTSDQSVDEGGGGIVLTAMLSAVSDRDVLATVSVAGTATRDEDYTDVPTELTIPAGETSAEMTFTLIDDAEDEDDETLVVSLTGITNAEAGESTDQLITIVDDDTTPVTPPTIQWSTDALTVSEEDGSVMLIAQLSAVAEEDVTATFTTSGTAEGEGVDYAYDAIEMTIPTGSDSVEVVVRITNDTLDEEDEVVTFTIDSADGATIGSPDIQTITILDPEDESVGEDWGALMISGPSNHTTEAGGSATIDVVLEEAPTADVTISFSSSDLTEGTVSTSVLIFTSDDWNIPQTITITGVDDAIDDGDVSYVLIFHPVVSEDPYYSGIDPEDVELTNDDNDPSSGSRHRRKHQTYIPHPEDALVTLSHINLSASSVLTGGETYTLTWSFTGFVPWMMMEGSVDGGDTWEQLVFQPNTGAATIEVPDVSTTSAVIRMTGTDLAETLVTAVSPLFTIEGTIPLYVPDEETETIFPAGFVVGDLVRLVDDEDVTTWVDAEVYYLGADGARHVFPTTDVIAARYGSTAIVQMISSDTLGQIPLGGNMTYGSGTLIKFASLSPVYEISSMGLLLEHGQDPSVPDVVISDALFGDYYPQCLPTG